MEEQNSKLDLPPIGLVGCGTIGQAIIEGICQIQDPKKQIYISPRNQEKANRLAEKFEQVTLGKDNQQVLDKSKVVFLAVHHRDFIEIMKQLKFREDHTVISVVAIHRGQALKEAVAPATDIARVIPLPAVALRSGLSIVTDHPLAIQIFDQLGSTVVAKSDDEFAALQAAGCIMGHFYKTCQTSGAWLQSHGVESSAAAKYVTGIYKTILAEATDRAEKKEDGVAGFLELVNEQTPGGLNEGVIKEMTEAGTYQSQAAALENAYEKLLGKKTQ